MVGNVIFVEELGFHTVWLRDNCLCSRCREPGSFQKIVDLGLLPGSWKPRSVSLRDGVLRVEWDEELPHESLFPVSWLRAHAYNPAPEPEENTTLWDAAWWKDRALTWHSLNDCDPDGGPWADDLARYGFALLYDVTEESLDSFISRIGPVFETEFGRTTVVQSMPNATDLALSGAELSAHTDFSLHMYTPALLQLMFCAEHEAEGGDSILVDGFNAAETLRAKHPEYFDILVNTSVNFQQLYSDRRYFHKRTRPIIELDQYGAISGVFFAHSHACNWQIPLEKVEGFYAAYHKLFDYLKDPANQLQIRLQAGQCVALQNGRLLHGRTAYKPESGKRTLITEFVSWEYFASRRRYYRDRHHYLTPNATSQC